MFRGQSLRGGRGWEGKAGEGTASAAGEQGGNRELSEAFDFHAVVKSEHSC